MLDELRNHWREYLMEASGLAGFIIVASLVTTVLEHPDLFVMQGGLGYHPLLRRVPLGLLLGTYIATIVYLFGERSGAHINPAVTAAFFYLGKINYVNAAFYVAAQFLGATFAAILMTVVLGVYYEHPSIHYVTTVPGSGSHAIYKALIAEFTISFILMFVMLIVISSKRLEKYAFIVTGVLIAIYLVVETPYSGMSMNPARSFGSAFAAGEWRYLWIYFAAPILAMLAAAQCFNLLKRSWLRNATWFKESPTHPQQAPPTA
jgi:aquaporin Z